MSNNKNLLISLIIPLVFLIYALITINNYGINWDEPYHYRRGQSFLQYFLTGKKDYSNIPKYTPLRGDSDNPDFRNSQKNLEEVQKNPSLSDPNFRRSFYQDDSWNGEFFIDLETSYGHPALNGDMAAVFNKIFYQKLGIIGDLESYRVFIILSVSLATIFIAIFMVKEYGLFESIVSTLAFASYPLLLGEQHFNIKDPVETAFYTITVLSAYLGVKKNKLSWLLISSLFFGLAMSTKFNILFSIVPIGVWFIYFLYRNSAKLNQKILTRNIVITAVVAPLLALGIMYLSFPTLWKNPVAGFEHIIKFYLEVGYPKTEILGYSYFGFFNSFPIIWIFYTTPPIILALFLSSILLFKKIINKNGLVLLLLVWIAVVIGRNSLFGALSYGGVRIIMEFITPLALLSGIAAGYLIKINKTKTFHLLSAIIILGSFIPTLIKLVKIHPNENVYFNFLIGGLKGAEEKNIPYWGDSYGNAYYSGILWLNSNAEKGAKVSVPVGLTGNIPRFKLRPDIAVSPFYWSGLKHDGEYLIELTYNYEQRNWFALKYLNQAMVPVYEIKVDGVAIAKVWKNDTSHLKEEFKSTKDIKASITPDRNRKTLKITLPAEEKIMIVKLTLPTKSCSQLKTGYVTTSSDDKNWLREKEDIATDQQNRQELKKLSPHYEYLFVATKAKYIVFNTDSPDNCLLMSTQAIITVLKN